jgi:uncharacterized membrane protein YgcG
VRQKEQEFLNLRFHTASANCSLPIPEDRLLFKETFMRKSRYSFVSLLFVLAFLAAGAVFFTTPTMAAPTDSPCNLTVNDAAKVLTTTQLANVTSSAKSLEAAARNSAVRVVTISKNPTNLAEFAYQQCGSLWHSNPSTLKPNMILLMVKPSTPGAQDGKSLAAAGSMYPELNSQNQNTLATMKPSLQKGDYAGGLIAGLHYMQQLAEVNSRPSSNADNSPAVTPQKTPADLTPLWIISGTIVALIVLATLAAFIIYQRRTKKGENAAKRVAQQDAKLMRTQAVNAVRELTDKMNDPTLQARIELVSQASTVNGEQLEQTYQALSADIMNLSIDLRNITTSASNPDDDKTVQEYQRIRTYFAPIVRQTDALQNVLTRLEHQLDEVERDPRVQLGTFSRQQRELGRP